MPKYTETKASTLIAMNNFDSAGIARSIPGGVVKGHPITKKHLVKQDGTLETIPHYNSAGERAEVPGILLTELAGEALTAPKKLLVPESLAQKLKDGTFPAKAGVLWNKATMPMSTRNGDIAVGDPVGPLHVVEL